MEGIDPARSRLGDRYQLLKVIGRGGTASVYLARDEFLGRDVAVKMFRASATAEKDFRRQEDEVNVLASLSHANLVTLFDAAVDRSDPEQPRIYYVMELVDGIDLHRRLKRGPLPARQIAQLGHDVAEGLEYIHGRGIVHRDIKPANILLLDHSLERGRARAKLTDFGIALRGESGELADDENVTGTVAYLSPEQARGEAIGPPSDIYSLGLVLLQSFTAELAFPGQALESTVARLNRDPHIPDQIPSAWRELIAAMTDREPANRPNIYDLVLALRQAVSDGSGRHKRTGTSILPSNEVARMEAVRRYDLLDTPPDGAFDRITALAARVFSVPIAIVSVVDHDRIWFKSHHGLELDEISREPGLCASAILQDGPWVIEDARADPRSLANPLVAGEFGLQFYAGVPLQTQDGFNLGTLCVLDFEPRTLSSDDFATLNDLAAVVMRDLDLRLETRRTQNVA